MQKCRGRLKSSFMWGNIFETEEKSDDLRDGRRRGQCSRRSYTRWRRAPWRTKCQHVFQRPATMTYECQNVLSVNESWLHNKISSARVVRSYFQWRPDNFELPIFNSADFVGFKGKCFRTLRSWREYQISSWIGWLRQTSRHMMLHTSQSAPFVVFDLYWEGTMEKLIIWTGGQRRLSYRYTLGNLQRDNYDS